MTILLVFVFLIGGSSDGGVAAQIHQTLFQNYAACESAAEKLRTNGQLWDNRVVKGGMYKILAVCAAER